MYDLIWWKVQLYKFIRVYQNHAQKCQKEKVLQNIYKLLFFTSVDT